MTTPAQQQSEPPTLLTAVEQEAERQKLHKQGLLETLFDKTNAEMQAHLEQAQAELMREVGVRERCYPGWIESGKVSRIDARERLTRIKKALDIINYLLDITGKHVTMTTDDVPF